MLSSTGRRLSPASPDDDVASELLELLELLGSVNGGCSELGEAVDSGAIPR